MDHRGRYLVTDESDKNIKVYDSRGRRQTAIGRVAAQANSIR